MEVQFFQVPQMYKIEDKVICFLGKTKFLEDIPEIKDARNHGGSRFARANGRLGTIQYINELAVVVRHTDNLFPNEEYEDAYYLIDEIKPFERK